MSQEDELVTHLRRADIGVCDEAADEIERLRAEVERWKLIASEHERTA